MNPAPIEPADPPASRPPSWRTRAGTRLAGLFRATARTDDLLADLPARIDELLRFGRETDEEFTAMALGLGGITRQLEAMGQRAAGLEAILQDRDGDRALESTHGLCKNAIELVHASLGTSHALLARMREADASLLQALAVREDFENNFMVLRALSMGIRIEAARVSTEFQGVFSQVAGAIRDIDEKIVITTGRAFSRMEALVCEAAADHDGTIRDETALYGQARESIDLVQRDIETLRRGLAPCAEALQRVSGQLEATAGPRTAILFSLQYQDIVRQKLEHVATGFRDIAQHSDDRVFLHRAAALQQTHLASAREEIVTAGREATAGLETLLRIGGEINSLLQTVESTAVAALARSHMDEIVERELLHLARIANRSAETNRRITARVERIEAVVRVFSGDVAGHQREVKLVALNAQIAAARLPSGGALEKLAEEASRVAQRNAETTERLAARLRLTLDRLLAIKQEADAMLESMNRDKSALESGAASVTDKLIRHRQAIQDQSRSVCSEFAEVQERTRALLDRIHFPDLIEGCFSAAGRLCRELEARTAASLATASLSLAGARRFRDHLLRYTMEEERAAHAAVIGDASAGAPSPAGDSPEPLNESPAQAAPEPEPARRPSAVPLSVSQERFPGGPANANATGPDAAEAPSSSRPATAQDLGDGIELF